MHAEKQRNTGLAGQALVALLSGATASVILVVLASRFYLSVTRPYAVFALLILCFCLASWAWRRRRYPAGAPNEIAVALVALAAFSLGFWGAGALLLAINPANF